MKQVQFIITIILLSNCHTFCQNKLKGLVVDSTKTPIAYATVYFEKSNTGVITNEDGVFTIEKNTTLNEELKISCIGYQSANIEVTSDTDRPIKIVLKHANINLNEIVVTPLDAEETVKSAINNFRKNYPKKTIKTNGIYKQITFTDNQHNTLFTGDVDIYLNNLVRKKNQKFVYNINDYELYKSETKPVYLKLSYILSNFFLYKKPFIKDIKKYKYTFDSKVEYQDMMLLKIDFQPQQNNQEAVQYKGSIYIDQTSFAIIYLDYLLLPNNRLLKYDNKKEKLVSIKQKIMFSKQNSFFAVKYILLESTAELSRGTKTFTVKALLNFFAKNTNYHKGRPEKKKLDFDEIMKINKGKTFNKSHNYSNDFILETTEEAKIKKNQFARTLLK